VEKTKSAYPHAGIGADIIVGFPSETDELFEETYEFVSELPITYLHVFSYSARPGTDAQAMECRVSPQKRMERSARLRQRGFEKKRSLPKHGKKKLFPFSLKQKRMVIYLVDLRKNISVLKSILIGIFIIKFFRLQFMMFGMSIAKARW
jgi:radical SAM superfamily enzyme YgiQ (UPF0313 family)